MKCDKVFKIREEKAMANKLWKKFGQLTENCYENLVGIYKDETCWEKAFDVLKTIVEDGRSKNKTYARELYLLDEFTDYEYDVQGWLEDYLDEIDMRENHEKLLSDCEWLIEVFNWAEYSPSDIYSRKASALSSLGKMEEAHDFCVKWLEREPDNMQAIASTVYAKLGVKDIEAAEKIVSQYIDKNTECTEENDILFVAAQTLYAINGNKKAKKYVDAALERYEQYLEDYFMGDGDDDDDFLDFLPFD